MSEAEKRVLEFLKQIEADDGWIVSSEITARQSTLNSLVDKGLIERNTVAGLSEYRAVTN